MKRLAIGLILVSPLSVPMVAMAVEQPIPVQAQIPGEFSCTITDEWASAASWWPTWALPPATTTTTKWRNIERSSNYDWQVSADMGSVGWLENGADPSIHLGDGLKIVLESWPESDVYVDGWSHKVADFPVSTPFDNDYSFKQTVANEQPGIYSGTVTFTCVNMYGGTATCGNDVREGTEACDDGNTVTGDGCSPTWTIESGYICTSNNYYGQAGCSLSIYCNDGYLDEGEECEGTAS